MSVSGSGRIVNQKTHAKQCPAKKEHTADPEEKSQWLIHHKGTDDRHHGTLHITKHTGKQSGFTKLRIGTDRHRLHCHSGASCLDDRLQGVGIFICYIQTHRCVTAISTETARCVRNIGFGCHTHGPASEMLKLFLER